MKNYKTMNAKKQHYLNTLNIINRNIRDVKYQIQKECTYNWIIEKERTIYDEPYIYCDKCNKTKF